MWKKTTRDMSSYAIAERQFSKLLPAMNLQANLINFSFTNLCEASDRYLRTFVVLNKFEILFNNKAQTKSFEFQKAGNEIF